VPIVPLSLSAISLDIVVALAQRPDGMGAGELGRIVDGAPTSVQNNLRVLLAHGLIHRSASRYLLTVDQPGVEDLVAAGLRLSKAEAALRLVLRASESVDFACEDSGGFIVGMKAKVDPASMAALEQSLATVRRGRPVSVPAILRFDVDELTRLIHSAVGLRARIGSATVLKGFVRGPGRLVQVGYPYRPGRTPQNS
jgi:hypothetical protein